MYIEEKALLIFREERWHQNQKGLEKFLEQLVYNTNESLITTDIIEKELERLHQGSSRYIRSYDEYEEELSVLH